MKNTSLRQEQRSSVKDLQMETPYGPLWRTMTWFVMEKSKPLTLSCLDPAALRWAVCHQGGGFAEFLGMQATLHPCRSVPAVVSGLIRRRSLAGESAETLQRQKAAGGLHFWEAT